MPFSKNDPNINREGPPKKDWTWASIIVDEADKIDEDDPEKKQKVKHKVARAIIKKAGEGDVSAFKVISDRTDGTPHQTSEQHITGDITIVAPSEVIKKLDETNRETSESSRE